MAKKKAAQKNVVDLTNVEFEAAMDELSTIVGELEDGRLGLSGSLERYEHGVQYLKHCLKLLESAEQRISLLTGTDADGNPVTEPYDEEEMGLEEKARSRSKRRTAGGKRPKSTKSSSDNVDVSGGLF